jgi:hypothetical protein
MILMVPKRLYSFKIDPAVADALKQIKARDGIGESEQIRRGIAMWLQSKGWRQQPGRRRAATRRRP